MGFTACRSRGKWAIWANPRQGIGDQFEDGFDRARTFSIIRGKEARSAATDRRIDDLVYELYGLGTDEIRLVEGCAESR